MQHKPTASLKKDSPAVNDAAIKWIAIPLTGIVVFYASGFAAANETGIPGLLLNYCCFAFISFSVWNLNTLVQSGLRARLYKIKKIQGRLPARYAITIVVTWAVSYLLLTLWNHYLRHNLYTPGVLFTSQVIMILVSIQLSSIYEIVYLNKERESDLITMERSEKLKVQAQLDALKSQIDPHFIFNSLNTLSYLIRQSPAKAQLFNDTLARVYRYILANKEKDLVPLKQEIEFASNYFYLLKIRYQTGLHLLIKMDSVSIEHYSIPPLSLQALIENAIKHNHFSEKMNLTIEITISENEIKVLNQKNNKKFDIQSSQIGLANLNERYSLIVNKDITIQQTPEYFKVLLPIVKSSLA
jgi:sensor histidine kinase YesM